MRTLKWVWVLLFEVGFLEFGRLTTVHSNFVTVREGARGTSWVRPERQSSIDRYFFNHNEQFLKKLQNIITVADRGMTLLSAKIDRAREVWDKRFDPPLNAPQRPRLFRTST
jgi:hypothetical protein